VVACSPAARDEGVQPGLRRREAQTRCPDLELIAHDPARDARAFEPVLVAVEALTPWVEVLRPGECAFPVRGAARHHGGEPALAVAVTAAVHAALGGRGGCRVGVADGTFAAGLAARHQAIVPPGGSRGFLAPFPVSTLERPDLADLLVRLGLRTLGDLAVLPRAGLATRFGPEGSRAHRLASGLEEWPRAARHPPPDLRVVAELDPPAGRVDVAAFAAKALADELVARLERLGLACTRLRIEAETEHGETLTRVWRHDAAGPSRPDPSRSTGPPPRGSPDPSAARLAVAMAERVRWQLDGWLAAPPASRPTGGLTRLALAPDEVVPDRGRQLGFWGEQTEAGERAARALARVQGLLGAEAVRTARLRGGRDPADRVTYPTSPGDPAPGPAAPAGGAGPAAPTAGGRTGLPPGGRGTPWKGPGDSPGGSGRGAPGDPAGGSGEPQGGAPDDRGVPRWDGPRWSWGPGAAAPGSAPWPGRVPDPAPAIVHPEPLPAEVVDAAGAGVTVDGRGMLGAPPSRLRIGDGGWSAIAAWAGPWPVDERWWNPGAHRRLARLQVATGEGAAHLLKLSGGRWWVEATYD
jgi:protein ImuB